MKEEKINGKTIIEWETEISKFNRKSLNITKFKEYIKKKSEINGMLFNFYEKMYFQKIKITKLYKYKKERTKNVKQFQTHIWKSK